jgi:hypothetical protein
MERSEKESSSTFSNSRARVLNQGHLIRFHISPDAAGKQKRELRHIAAR